MEGGRGRRWWGGRGRRELWVKLTARTRPRSTSAAWRKASLSNRPTDLQPETRLRGPQAMQRDREHATQQGRARTAAIDDTRRPCAKLWSEGQESLICGGGAGLGKQKHLVARTRHLKHEGVREKSKSRVRFGGKLVLGCSGLQSRVPRGREILAVTGWRLRIRRREAGGGGWCISTAVAVEGGAYRSSQGRRPQDTRVSEVQQPTAHEG